MDWLWWLLLGAAIASVVVGLTMLRLGRTIGRHDVIDEESRWNDRTPPTV